MNKIISYKDLIVWQKSIVLVREIYVITQKLPNSELYNLTIQMRRSAISIPSNIAEGYRRRNIKEYIQFLSIALASAAELETQLIITSDMYKYDCKNIDRPTAQRFFLLKLHNFGCGFAPQCGASPRLKFWSFINGKSLSSRSNKLLEEIQKMLYVMIEKLNPQPSTLNPHGGFTLLETTIVIAITIILSTVMLGYNRSSEKQIVLYRDQAIIVGLINRAKSLALQKFNVENACAFGVRFEPSGRFIIFADKKLTGECKDADGVYQIDGVYNSSEELSSEQSIFFLDSRLMFKDLTGSADLIFIPPALEVQASFLPMTIKIAVRGGTLCSSLAIGAGGQITEGNC